MKKIIVGLITILITALIYAPVSAKIKTQYLYDTGGTAWNEKAMTTSTGTYYSDGIPLDYSEGYTSLLIETSAGSLVVTYEISLDDSTYYSPYGKSGAILNPIASALTADRWIVFAAAPAPYIRFKFVLTSADSTVSAQYIQVE